MPLSQQQCRSKSHVLNASTVSGRVLFPAAVCVRISSKVCSSPLRLRPGSPGAAPRATEPDWEQSARPARHGVVWRDNNNSLSSSSLLYSADELDVGSGGQIGKLTSRSNTIFSLLFHLEIKHWHRQRVEFFLLWSFLSPLLLLLFLHSTTETKIILQIFPKNKK